jgi:hypothetical protein
VFYPGIPANKSLLCLRLAFSIVGDCALALFLCIEAQPFQPLVSVVLFADIILPRTIGD